MKQNKYIVDVEELIVTSYQVESTSAEGARLEAMSLHMGQGLSAEQCAGYSVITRDQDIYRITEHDTQEGASA